MYNSGIFCVLLTIMLAIMVIHTAEAADPISLSTNNDIYYNGDHVVVFGKVNTIFEDRPITIQIYYESNLIGIAQPDVAADGTFVGSFYATGSKWKDEGTYTVRAQYTPTQKASHVLKAMGFNHEQITGSLRISFGYMNTLNEVNQTVEVLKKVVAELRSVSPYKTKYNF